MIMVQHLWYVVKEIFYYSRKYAPSVVMPEILIHTIHTHSAKMIAHVNPRDSTIFGHV